jgi:hypothetical protein
MNNEKLKEALNLMKAVEPYLEGSSDVRAVLAVYIPPAQQLRNAADALEKKDAAIARFREFIQEHY